MEHNSVLEYWRNRGHRLPDLKACPLCGSESALSDDSELVHQTNPEADAGAFFCSCPSCGLTDGSYRTPEQAVEHWNRRMSDRRHGYWMPRLRTDPTRCRCSICHVVSWSVASGEDDGRVCRHCGAVMDVPDPYMVTRNSRFRLASRMLVAGLSWMPLLFSMDVKMFVIGMNARPMISVLMFRGEMLNGISLLEINLNRNLEG